MVAPKHSTNAIPCAICGADAGQDGWVQGFIPSAGSLKMGLCREHDTPDNRRVVIAAWQKLLQREIANMAALEEHRAASPQVWRLEIDFTDGGSVCLESLGCTSGKDTLQVILPDKSLRFFPLIHVRHYSLRPLPPEAATKALSAAKADA